MEGRKEIKYPREIIMVGGGSGWHFTDRPFATFFGYTPIYQSVATYRLQRKQNGFMKNKNYMNLIYC